ncbi:chemotaxis protein CheW [Pleomorphomonas diazotrophica]|jgi:purine-binding chemotaxis protein CheW|uniref:Chemotaxis protein CheW n=1 Tax=Pleomorphomonas diazotrophica TaxID=1166257 RepID=A0A1I4W176_9HYPH|nr:MULTISPECIES: chemotaxis protein CheW [Pleomorphomonas]MCM5555008.1 chemotaxis protein CheW [Pleomorphomonas sp. NRK KF1]PKR88210.1 chemotaxis protein CheW [Pleomorphomonas diazotrophica]SFN07324.1 CheW protein [Pleomorphomonas diazotrophica]
MTATSHTPGAAANDSHSGQIQYVTVFIGGQLFGLPIHKVHDVFVPESMTRVPLSAPEVAGVLNLRGRIVTAINMRRRLGLPQREGNHGIMAVGIEYRGESYGLIIDEVGEVLNLDAAGREANPANLDGRWAEISGGVHRLSGQLMVILDVERVLGRMQGDMAA